MADLPGRITRSIASRRRARSGRGQQGYQISPEEALADGAGETDIGRAFFNSQRPVTKWRQYFDAYEAEFAPFRGKPVRMLEIGVFKGGSLQMWREYLGPEATIFGIDISPECAEFEEPGISVRIGSQDDPEFLRSVVAEMGGLDIVLDDGSHVAEHQITAFETLFPLMADGGLYAIEDLHTSYWHDYGGGYGRSGGFMEVIKRLLDDMHGWYHPRAQSVSVNAVANIPRIAIYDSIAFISKRRTSRPTNFMTGDRPRDRDHV